MLEERYLKEGWYRAKDVTTRKWDVAYGHFLMAGGYIHFIVRKENSVSSHTVDPNTICSLADRQRPSATSSLCQDVWEGDIVSCVFNGHLYPNMVVCYEPAVENEKPYVLTFGTKTYDPAKLADLSYTEDGDIDQSEYLTDCDALPLGECRVLEVVGNIYDQPELIGGISPMYRKIMQDHGWQVTDLHEPTFELRDSHNNFAFLIHAFDMFEEMADCVEIMDEFVDNEEALAPGQEPEAVQKSLLALIEALKEEDVRISTSIAESSCNK